MQYMLLIYWDETLGDDLPAEVQEKQQAETMAGYIAFNKEIRSRGLMLAGDALQPTSTATSVRLRNNERIVTDGPFAETKEALGGYYLVDAKDLDEAIELAAKIPTAGYGTIEVRPVMDLSHVPGLNE